MPFPPERTRRMYCQRCLNVHHQIDAIPREARRARRAVHIEPCNGGGTAEGSSRRSTLWRHAGGVAAHGAARARWAALRYAEAVRASKRQNCGRYRRRLVMHGEQCKRASNEAPREATSRARAATFAATSHHCLSRVSVPTSTPKYRAALATLALDSPPYPSIVVLVGVLGVPQRQQSAFLRLQGTAGNARPPVKCSEQEWQVAAQSYQHSGKVINVGKQVR